NNLKTLAKKLGLAEIERFKQEVSSYNTSFVADKLKQTEVTHNSGIAFRVINNGRFGFASGYGLCNEEAILAKAKDLSKFYPKSLVQFPGEIKVSESHEMFDVGDVFSGFKLKGYELMDYIRTRINSNSVLIDLSFDLTDSKEIIENSNNLYYSTIKRLNSFSINLRETLENDFIEIFSAVTENKQLDFIECVDEVIKLFNHSKRHADIKSAHMPVLFSSRAAKELISLVELALSGKQVNQNSSPWSDSLGKKVLDSKISLTQDPSYGCMARSIDDEGVSVQLLHLISNGVLENFYYDLQTAAKSSLNVSSTGNGFKSSLSALPEPELLNVIVKPGTRSLEEIIKSIDYGLYVDQTIGGLSSN
ncbi:MAG: TldD/PmbA family protein, partial [Candidatus Melainabacteria bacterium]|nr:TldD/PmbA family protein [Candidatus Melainabacteria bacterium]